jgi:hypothetical protein
LSLRRSRPAGRGRSAPPAEGGDFKPPYVGSTTTAAAAAAAPWSKRANPLTFLSLLGSLPLHRAEDQLVMISDFTYVDGFGHAFPPALRGSALAFWNHLDHGAAGVRDLTASGRIQDVFWGFSRYFLFLLTAEWCGLSGVSFLGDCAWRATYDPDSSCFSPFIHVSSSHPCSPLHVLSAMSSQPFSLSHVLLTIFSQPCPLNHFLSLMSPQPCSLTHLMSPQTYPRPCPQPFSLSPAPSTMFSQSCPLNHVLSPHVLSTMLSQPCTLHKRYDDL